MAVLTPPDWTDLLEEDTLADMVPAALLLDTETSSASSTRYALGRVLTAKPSVLHHRDQDRDGELPRPR